MNTRNHSGPSAGQRVRSLVVGHWPFRHSAGRRGFTAIELLGVLTIIALLSAMALVSAQQQVKLATRKAEVQSLDSLADALTNRVKASLSIPSPADWQPYLAERLAISVADASANRMGNTRVVLADPTMDLGAPGAATSLPYQQSVIGSRKPKNVRFVIVSSLTDPVPGSIITNAFPTTTFNNLWNSTEGAKPTGWPTTWKGDAEDIQIRRVDLTGLFHRVVLYNLDTDNEATWTMEGADFNGSLDVVQHRDTPRVWDWLDRWGGDAVAGFAGGYGGRDFGNFVGGHLFRELLRAGQRSFFPQWVFGGVSCKTRTHTCKVSKCTKTTSPPPPGTPPPETPPPAEENPDAFGPKAIEMWVLDGTGLSLLDINGNLAVREIVHHDASYVFEDGRWRWHLGMGLSSNNVNPEDDLSDGELAQLVDDFLAAPGSYSAKYAVVENLFLWFREARFWGTEANYSSWGNSSYWWDRVNDYRQLINNGATKLP